MSQNRRKTETIRVFPDDKQLIRELKERQNSQNNGNGQVKMADILHGLIHKRDTRDVKFRVQTEFEKTGTYIHNLLLENGYEPDQVNLLMQQYQAICNLIINELNGVLNKKIVTKVICRIPKYCHEFEEATGKAAEEMFQKMQMATVEAP